MLSVNVNHRVILLFKNVLILCGFHIIHPRPTHLPLSSLLHFVLATSPNKTRQNLKVKPSWVGGGAHL